MCAGPVLLQRLGLRDKVTQALDSALARAPGDADFRRMRDALSPDGQISELLEEGQASDALGLIAALPRRARSTEEVVSLKARALMALGIQDAELNRIDDAIDRWAQALDAAPGRELTGNSAQRNRDRYPRAGGRTGRKRQ